ncbi:sigma-70 family RNA polymerase sigma factor [Brevibacillus sp. TJ4]|uniref:sigma-70 family RNA polymerase sigma factor n=1 Tax=Brevibacillus sp. TJ4 TaxID=3234853 RepID=UPI0037CD519E
MSQQTVDPQAWERLGKFRKKVVQLAIIERKSIYETAIACGCTAEKVKRVLKKWRALSKASPLPAQGEKK